MIYTKKTTCTKKKQKTDIWNYMCQKIIWLVPKNWYVPKTWHVPKTDMYKDKLSLFAGLNLFLFNYFQSRLLKGCQNFWHPFNKRDWKWLLIKVQYCLGTRSRPESGGKVQLGPSLVKRCTNDGLVTVHDHSFPSTRSCPMIHGTYMSIVQDLN